MRRSPLTASPSTTALIQVCPPSAPRPSWAQRPDAAWRRLARRWRLLPATETERLEPARQAFLDSLHGIGATDSARWRMQVKVSQSLHELWHLRTALFGMVAARYSEGEAARRLSVLDVHFPTRPLRSGFTPSDS